MTTSKAAKKDEDAQVEETPEPVVTTSFTFDGLRAVDTVDGVQQDAREATFAEQVAALAPQVRDQAVGIIHGAVSGSVETIGNVITITLDAR